MDAMLPARPSRLWKNKTDFFRPFRPDTTSATHDGTLLPSTTHSASISQHSGNVDEEELLQMNSDLEILVGVFPDVEPGYFRNLLLNVSKESRVAIVAEHMLRSKNASGASKHRSIQRTWLGRESGSRSISRRDRLVMEETFRGRAYIQATKVLLYQEFKQLSHASIKAVMAENNSSYTKCRPVLQHLASKTWRYALTNFWSRRVVSTNIGDCPAIAWTKHLDGSSTPEVKDLGSASLQQEVHDLLVQPILCKQNQEQLARDHCLAIELNATEATAAHALHDCQCCYSSVAFEQVASCNANCHFLCFDCIRRTANEAIYGQGWARSVDLDKASLRCFAPAAQECPGSLPMHSVQLALDQDRDASGTWSRLQDKITSDVLCKSRLPLQRCPSCTYAETDEISDVRLRSPSQIWQLTKSTLRPDLVFTVLACLGLASIVLVCLADLVSSIWSQHCHSSFDFALIAGTVLTLLAALTLPVTLLHLTSLRFDISRIIEKSLHRVRRKRGGLKFICQRQDCSKTTCKKCLAEWRDPHTCFENEKTSLRTAIESSATAAVKRTCPRCMLSFVKSSGCNKLVCNCGYIMCYICRNEIASNVGYAHFCQHFRPNGGRCTECAKCDLYGDEDEEAAIRKAAEAAELMWRDKHAVSATNDDIQRSKHMIDSIVGQNSKARWQEICLDFVVDMLLVTA